MVWTGFLKDGPYGGAYNIVVHIDGRLFPSKRLPAAGGNQAPTRRTMSLEDENTRLWRIVADLALDKQTLQEDHP